MAEREKYRIIEKLDSGGMAEVFLGEAEALEGFKRRVAIKRILPHLTKNRRFVQMFLDEARLSLQLQHANIVSVYDIGKSGNTFFIVMEYVDGTNLKQVLAHMNRQGRLVPMEQAIFIIREVCEGLAYAHDQKDPNTGRPLGIGHRDVSPPNILISMRGEVKLVDFGLAKATTQLETTDPGVVKGKFSYLSPEAASGLEVDRRADIFAAGIILWELLTGRRLFYGENDYQTVELVREANIPPMALANPNVPAELEAILLKALARNPDDRYQSASEFSEALTKFLFKNGLAVTRNDIARLVKAVREGEEKAAGAPGKPQVKKGIIDIMIQEEIQRFTSLDDLDDPFDLGAKPLSPEDVSMMGPLDPGDFIDPRGWAADLMDESGPVASAAPSTTPEPAFPVEVTDVETPGVPAPAGRESNDHPSDAIVASHRRPSPPPKAAKSNSLPIIIVLVVLVFVLSSAAAVLYLLGYLG